jgi:hypothetical protein
LLVTVFTGMNEIDVPFRFEELPVPPPPRVTKVE